MVAVPSARPRQPRPTPCAESSKDSPKLFPAFSGAVPGGLVEFHQHLPVHPDQLSQPTLSADELWWIQNTREEISGKGSRADHTCPLKCWAAVWLSVSRFLHAVQSHQVLCAVWEFPVQGSSVMMEMFPVCAEQCGRHWTPATEDLQCD